MFKKFLKKIWRLIKLVPLATLVLFLIVFLLSFLIKDETENKSQEENNEIEAIFLIQPWQLNSRYKINKIVKFLKLDLDEDGKDELAVITSYDKFENEVFYYAGFYRFNPITDKWDGIYEEDLNIVNYGMIDESKIDDVPDFKDKLTKIWSEEFTILENIGDITGDSCPEIVFSSLIQGEYFDNYIIVAQAGKSHYRFKIFTDQKTLAKIVTEDSLLIDEYYQGDNLRIKDIYEWDDQELKFIMIEQQKEKVEIEKPKVDPELVEITG